jgi:hypothetical protein
METHIRSAKQHSQVLRTLCGRLMMETFPAGKMVTHKASHMEIPGMPKDLAIFVGRMNVLVRCPQLNKVASTLEGVWAAHITLMEQPPRLMAMVLISGLLLVVPQCAPPLRGS